MILVILGTQDKDFSRLLKVVDKEIEKGNIKDRVIVQSGYTKYKSSNMEIHELLSTPDFEELVKKADLIITHGGVGTILTAIKNNKSVIAAARLKKYGEHHNDHQKQIIKEFADKGYILALNDFTKLGKVIEKSRHFKPKRFISNRDNIVNKLSDYIEDTNNVSWYNKYCLAFRYTFLGLFINALGLFINALGLFISSILNISLWIRNIFAWLLFIILIAFIKYKGKVFDNKRMPVLLISIMIDILIIYLLTIVFKKNVMLSKIISLCTFILINFILGILIAFHKKEENNEK